MDGQNAALISKETTYDVVDNVVANMRIDSGKRIVEKQHICIEIYGSCQIDTLLLSA